MAFRYSTEFRDKICRRLLDGDRVEDLVHELEVSAQTLYRWKKRALIDAGLRSASRASNPTSCSVLVGASRTSRAS